MIMKKHFLKSFALIAMLFSALTLSAASGVDWSTYTFLGDGAGGGKYTDKYKVSAADGLTVINIQQPGFTSEPSIYATVPAGISDCNVSSTIQGAGIALHLSAFTAQETQVTINYAGGSCTFWVYYADGLVGETPGEGGTDTPATPTEVLDVNFALASNGSSAEATSGNAAAAIDNNTGTRWESASEDPQTWTLDLGQARIVNTIEIDNMPQGFAERPFKPILLSPGAHTIRVTVQHETNGVQQNYSSEWEQICIDEESLYMLFEFKGPQNGVTVKKFTDIVAFFDATNQEP